MKIFKFAYLIFPMIALIAATAYANDRVSSLDDKPKLTVVDKQREVSDTSKNQNSCSALIVALGRLELDAINQPVSVDMLTNQDWLKILQTFVQEPEYKTLVAKSQESSQCSLTDKGFINSLNGFLRSPDKGSAYYKPLMGYFTDFADFWYNNKQYSPAFVLYNLVGDNDETGTTQYKIANMFRTGTGIDKDLGQAAAWYGMAIAKEETQGDQERLEITLDESAGVFVDAGNYRMAFTNLSEAAKMGFAWDQFKLALFYAQGYGVIQNNKKAYAWVSVAILQGLPDQKSQTDAETTREILVNKLNEQDPTGKELKDAKALAQQYYQLYVLHQKPTPPSFSERLSKAIQVFNN